MAQVTIEGVKNVQDTLQRIAEVQLVQAMSNIVDATAKVVADEAKKLCPVDTGALQQSIEGGITKITPTTVEGMAGAGNERVVRGEGRFDFSKKQQRIVTRQPTSHYAQKVNDRTPFMDSALKRGEDYIKRKMISELQKIVR